MIIVYDDLMLGAEAMVGYEFEPADEPSFERSFERREALNDAEREAWMRRTTYAAGLALAVVGDEVSSYRSILTDPVPYPKRIRWE